jgi:signal transduction histidine kinase
VRSHRTWRDTITLTNGPGAPLPVSVVLAPTRMPDRDGTWAIATITDATDFVRVRNVQRLSNDISLIISRRSQTDTQAMDLAKAMVRDFADWCAIHLHTPEGTLALVALASRSGKTPAGSPGADINQNGIGKAFASGIPLLHQPSHPENPALLRQMQRIVGEPVRAVASVPIAASPVESFGTITWAISDDARLYHHEDVRAAEEVGMQFGHYLHENEIRESLSHAVRAREGFMKAAGHELRTPLVSIKGYTQLLLRDFRRQTISPQRLEAGLKAIDTSTSRLTDLMEDLFAVSNPGLNALPLRLVPVDISIFVREFLSTTPSLTLAGHRFHLEEAKEPLMAKVDLTRFSQVLFNVAINAVHFSPAGSDICVATRRDGDFVVISIQDAGKGLSPGEESSIFDPFNQADSWYGSDEQGLGIGLYISRQIMVRHKGDIWAESEGPDKGATFHIRVPHAPEPDRGPETANE